MSHEIFDLRIRNFPGYARGMIAGYLLALTVGYGYAIGNITLVVGMTPEKVALHYAGSQPGGSSNTSGSTTGEQELNLDEVVEAPQAVAPSFKNLVGEGHFHLFGMSSFFFGLCLIGLFLDISSRWKTLLLTAPFALIVLDNLSFMATRFGGPSFSYLTVAVGSLMGVNFLALWYLIVKELLLAGRRSQ
ncbi:MAG: hypothetical protein KDD51_08340 [Bdellovibrionales bacterium]|nr:hypothetical protein [Bdellovibrionales bacterium]